MDSLLQEEFLDTAYQLVHAHHDDMVARLQLRVARDGLTFAVAHHTTEGDSPRQTEFLDTLLGDVGTGLSHQVGHFGIDQTETLGRGLVSIEQQLVDAAGTEQLLTVQRY